MGNLVADSSVRQALARVGVVALISSNMTGHIRIVCTKKRPAIFMTGRLDGVRALDQPDLHLNAFWYCGSDPWSDIVVLSQHLARGIPQLKDCVEIRQAKLIRKRPEMERLSGNRFDTVRVSFSWRLQDSVDDTFPFSPVDSGGILFAVFFGGRDFDRDTVTDPFVSGNPEAP